MDHQKAACRKFRHTASDGKSYQTLHYNLRAVGKVLPGALTRIAAPGAERGPEPEGAWGASDADGWRYFDTLDEACTFAAWLHRSEMGADCNDTELEALEFAGRIARRAGE